MNNGDMDARVIIEALENALRLLDKNGFAIPAIKIEEAINALKQIEHENSRIRDQDI